MDIDIRQVYYQRIRITIRKNLSLFPKFVLYYEFLEAFIFNTSANLKCPCHKPFCYSQTNLQNELSVKREKLHYAVKYS